MMHKVLGGAGTGKKEGSSSSLKSELTASSSLLWLSVQLHLVGGSSGMLCRCTALRRW